MNSKKSGGRWEKPRSKTKSDHLYKAQLIKVVAGLTLIIALIVIAVGLAHHLLLKPKISILTPPAAKNSGPPEAHFSQPAYEIFPEHDRPPSTPLTPYKGRRPISDLPRVAIIIDDIGYDLKIARKFIELDGPLTFAVLPGAPYNSSIIDAAHTKGFEIMLHLPMEPEEYPKVNPGPQALITTMDPDRLIAQLHKNLSGIPYLKGVNNHMGSKMTASSSRMRQIFTILKKKGLYFIDSRTSADTICRSSAQLLKIPFAERDIFIDHLTEPEFIRDQIDKLIQYAQKNGQAVGIAHPHMITFDVLRSLLPRLRKEIQLVPASQVVRQL